jgi:hypothetical protein
VGAPGNAGQFNIGLHALCWVHAERLVRKLDTFTDQHRAARQRVPRIDLGLPCRSEGISPGARPAKRRLTLRPRFDRIFRRRTAFAALDRLLARLYANKAELLTVLQRRRFRCITTAPKTTSDARPQDVKPAPEPAAISAVTVATPSSD